MALSEDLKEANVVLIVTSKGKYNESLNAIIPELEKSVAKIGYISINKPFNSIVGLIKNKNLNVDKFFFCDAITATVQAPPVVNNCIFISSPTALTDLGLAFTSLMTEKNCDLVFFDTISTLGIYQDSGSVIKFVHNLITKSRVLNKKAVFFALKEDSETLVKDLNMFVDNIIEI